MARESSAESTKAPNPSGKKKGSRSVTSLSQEALNRKRANDREAQRAIRARTKEHIEKLEQEVKELKDKHYGSDLVRSLSQENQQLREQVAALRAIAANQSYARSQYEDPVNTRYPSRASSYGHHSPGYTGASELSAPFISPTTTLEAWPGSAMAVPASSNGASPAASSNMGVPDEAVPSYVTSNLPASVAAGPTVALPHRVHMVSSGPSAGSTRAVAGPRYQQPPTSVPMAVAYVPQQQPQATQQEWAAFGAYFTSSNQM